MGFFDLFRSRLDKRSGFEKPGKTACFTCDHVLDREKPVSYVVHDVEGDWQFLCGEEGHDESNIRVVGLGEILELDPSLTELGSIELGSAAERDGLGTPWIIRREPSEAPNL